MPTLFPSCTTSSARTLGVIIVGICLTITLACNSTHETAPCRSVVHEPQSYNSGIVLAIRDANGGAQALGDTAITYSGTDSAIVISSDTLLMHAGFQDPGSYSVRVKRKYYQDALVSNIRVAGDVCGGVISTTIPVTMTLAPGAPALRSIGIIGATDFGGPFKQNQLTARFDADASVPRWTIWRLSDTTAARIDVNGLVTSKCVLKARGADTVFAISPLDTSVRARVSFTVAAVMSCFMPD